MKLPKSFYNPLSIIGSIIASVNLVIILFFLIASIFFDVGGSYVGIYMYMILPVFLIGGLLFIAIGMVRRSRRIKREGAKNLPKRISLDLSDKKQWNAALVFLVVTFLFLLLTGIGSYQAYHYTESNEFCGLLCHKVMEPEYVAYQGSTHSRVKCVECHIGEGVDWFVKSKLSGLYQVYSVLTKKYPTPIETPVHSLRPARETCERCHWPEKFYSYRLRTEKHFLADSANTEWNIQLNMKIGAEHSALGLTEGIHWHINKDVKIEYIASDRKREVLPWVRYINLQNNDTVVYQDMYEALDPEVIDSMEIRVMDCMDCHNRPSHHYLPPQEFIDNQLVSGAIPVELPEIKMLAMQLLNTPYPDRDSARQVIENGVLDYYRSFYPELIERDEALVIQALDGIMTAYSSNIFPEMKASWDVYPNHVGHVEFNGCFRCHNGNHVSEDNTVISRDCNLCHTIVAQGTNESYETTTIDKSLEFHHPVDIDEAWKEMACSDCHRYLY
jgi:nitrate/TMAO reductase-like tetraheme cytochrome c subunit